MCMWWKEKLFLLKKFKKLIFEYNYKKWQNNQRKKIHIRNAFVSAQEGVVPFRNGTNMD